MPPGVIPVALKEPPVGQAFPLERQAVIGSRDVLHPVYLPLEVVALPAIAVDLPCFTHPFRLPILDICFDNPRI